MQSTSNSRRSDGSVHRRCGFTLIELIVSLTVISVATTILTQLYLTSTDLGLKAQHRELAASVAEGQLAQLVADPSAYHWDQKSPGQGGLFRIKRNTDDPRVGSKVALPEVLLPLDASFLHQENLYDKFRWSAFGRLPSEDSAYFEVTVDVTWNQAGKTEHVAITSAVPRSAVEPDRAEK